MSHKGIHLCEICNKGFTTHWGMARHRVKVHKEPQPITYESYLEEKEAGKIQGENLGLRVECLETELELSKATICELTDRIEEIENKLVAEALNRNNVIRSVVLSLMAPQRD